DQVQRQRRSEKQRDGAAGDKRRPVEGEQPAMRKEARPAADCDGRGEKDGDRKRAGKPKAELRVGEDLGLLERVRRRLAQKAKRGKLAAKKERKRLCAIFPQFASHIPPLSAGVGPWVASEKPAYRDGSRMRSIHHTPVLQGSPK